MLNECLLNDLNHVVRATSNTSQRHSDVTKLIERHVSMEALINKFLLDDFPKFVVLQKALGSTTDCIIQGPDSLAVQSGHLLLDKRN